MSWVDQVISEFGKNIGVPELQLNHEGLLRMQYGEYFILEIYHIKGLPIQEVIVSLARKIDYTSCDYLKSLLQQANFQITPLWNLHISMTAKSIVKSIRCPERSFRLNLLEQSINQLENSF